MTRYDTDDEYDYYNDSPDYANNPLYDDYGRRITAIADYGVDEYGCKTSGFTPFAISVYYTYEEGVDRIVEYIRDHLDDYCKKGISPSYFTVSRVLDANDFLVLLTYTPDREREYDERIVGFALVSDLSGRTSGNDDSLYIDVICSNNSLHHTRFPGGKVILNAIVEYARESGYGSVSLKALSNVVNYYRQFGFRFLKNGESDEQPNIHALAEANKSQRISSTSEANRILLIERAILFAREVDEEGVPVLNKELLRDNLKEQLALNASPTNSDVSDLVNRVSEHARHDGRGGMHDLFFTLIKSGYADLKGCPGITKRQFVRPEEVTPGVWKLWMSCEEGGFQMRKVLRPCVSSDADVYSPIIQCDHVGGRRKRPTRRRAPARRRLTRRR